MSVRIRHSYFGVVVGFSGVCRWVRVSGVGFFSGFGSELGLSAGLGFGPHVEARFVGSGYASRVSGLKSQIPVWALVWVWDWVSGFVLWIGVTVFCGWVRAQALDLG